MRHPRSLLVVGLALSLVLAACGGGDDGEAADGTDADTSTTTTAAPVEATEEPYADFEPDLYADGANWLCRPDQDDICDTSLDATAVSADGTLEVEEAPTGEQAVDCFYVYPTVSADAGPRADLEPSPAQEGNAALNQVARFSPLCRVFAPVYRQITIGGLGGVASEEDREVAYGDVVDAWKTYVTEDNDGRGVVLVGHSQGSGHLRRLIEEEIDGQPLQDRLVSAVLLGSSVAVPDSEVVGGDFDTVPICTEEGEVGCVISFATFRATDPPPATTFFGVVEGPERAACTNPAALGGGSATLTPYFTTAGQSPLVGADAAEITTEWVTYPDFLSAECVQSDDVDWLELTIAADPADPRTDDIPGDLTPEWGLHLVDANVAMGDLYRVVEAQAAAFAG